MEFEFRSSRPQPLVAGGLLRGTAGGGRAFRSRPIHAYHLAEHHATPLGMAPSPSVFLAAVAQRTKRLRFGPMIYALPLYHPLRMIEEICMLDQMSGGRLDVGFGRGASPIELDLFGTNPRRPAISTMSRWRSSCRASQTYGELQGQALQFRQRADGDDAAAAASSADLVWRACQRQRRAKRQAGPECHKPRRRQGHAWLQQILSHGLEEKMATAGRCRNSGSAACSWWPIPTPRPCGSPSAPIRCGRRALCTCSRSMTGCRRIRARRSFRRSKRTAAVSAAHRAR